MRGLFLGFVVVAAAQSAYAQTTEQRLAACMIKELAAYQPVSAYSEHEKCEVRNKRPLRSTPSKGPYEFSAAYPGHIIISAQAVETFKISDGGHTAPYITPRKDKVSVAIWCKAESKDFGKSGKYHVRLFGEKQRLATRVEQRRALQKCSVATEGLWKQEG